MVAHVLRLAETWGAWDGRPLPADNRVYTPHKAIRRVADHMVDHVAQLEAHITGAEPLPDRWRGSHVTTSADLAPFTPEDLNEARSRLERLAQLWWLGLAAIPPEELDRAEGGAYTPREWRSARWARRTTPTRSASCQGPKSRLRLPPLHVETDSPQSIADREERQGPGQDG